VAEFSYFLKMDLLDGLSKEPGHTGWFKLESWSFDPEIAGSSVINGGSLHFIVTYDNGGAIFFSHLGRTFRTARLELLKGRTLILRADLTNPNIWNFQTCGEDHCVTLIFGEMKNVYPDYDHLDMTFILPIEAFPPQHQALIRMARAKVTFSGQSGGGLRRPR
jgi:hypothetical protein